MKKHLIFFGENGLTSTSANHVANLAKESYQAVETKLQCIRFYSTTVKLLASTNDSTCIENGVDSEFLAGIPSMLDYIAKCKSLIAWLREAIKAKETLIEELNNLSFDDWLEEKGIEVPQKPIMEDVLTEDEYYGSLDVKQRNRYYQLEAQAATIGKYIHSAALSIADAREALNNKLSNPIELKGTGSDAMVFTYTPTVSPKDVEDVFFDLQKKHREIQAQLNSIKHECQEAIEKDSFQKKDAYNSACKKYKAEVDELLSRKSLDMTERLSRISHLKIIIPDSLKSLYDVVIAFEKGK